MGRWCYCFGCCSVQCSEVGCAFQFPTDAQCTNEICRPKIHIPFIPDDVGMKEAVPARVDIKA